jgi:hypothetical protein
MTTKPSSFLDPVFQSFHEKLGIPEFPLFDFFLKDAIFSRYSRLSLSQLPEKLSNPNVMVSLFEEAKSQYLYHSNLVEILLYPVASSTASHLTISIVDPDNALGTIQKIFFRNIEVLRDRDKLIDTLLNLRIEKDRMEKELEQQIEEQETLICCGTILMMQTDNRLSRLENQEKRQKETEENAFQKKQQDLFHQKKRIESKIENLKSAFEAVNVKINDCEILLEPVPVMAEIF